MLNNFFELLDFKLSGISGVSWFSWPKLLNIYKNIIEIINYVEELSKDGKIDKADKKKIAIKIVLMFFAKIDIVINSDDLEGFINIVVAIMNCKYFKKK